jgi:hypothetical protein
VRRPTDAAAAAGGGRVRASVSLAIGARALP